jgi:hypothetical protein
MIFVCHLMSTIDVVEEDVRTRSAGTSAIAATLSGQVLAVQQSASLTEQGRDDSVSAACDIAAAIPLFVTFEVRGGDPTCSLGSLAPVWQRARIPVLGVICVVDVATKFPWTLKPGACSNEGVSMEPFRPVVSGWSAAEGCDVEVAVGTNRGHADVDAHLGLGRRRSSDEETGGNSGYAQQFKSTHKFTCISNT